ncbi:MAG TPA: UDP-N-acetylmuramate--L-alanine ligase [Niabella sp.]|nr:UDP-N-acetylmuramate--L-alanine ligase [Niabella sp.]HOZ95550.1 UDP-N-acetylmuramate--L-alanine ligase [Niabella sp.]HQW13790.1 UDP-N-acetylmuramate--L-alanine ligase [Niabella sp.]HQX19317.1 UDP-N-acetylmuramate--L-alanine ligase [Niabella sp.]HQX40827.1 UDP-N-acetylmuramate--L-alanine ligase [Niabella sp.]
MSNTQVHINDIKSIYFIGIGGIGMSAIARYFLSVGKTVSGYDRTETAITKQLVAEGIDVHYHEDVNQIPKAVEYVVYTPAIPKEHQELVYYQTNGYNVVKRSDILGVITQGSYNVCVAGTHGKTTTSTMIAHLLRDTGYGCNAFLGGISANYNTNFWSNERNLCVIEADEYDRSFLKLSPDVAIITAVDADHLDIYGTAENVKDAFRQFAQKVKPGGILIKKFGLDLNMKADRTMSYSLQNDSADIYATNIELRDGGYRFDAVLDNKTISGVELFMGGMHNVENMMAAISVANHLEIEEEKIKAAVAGFKGVKRRFEYIVKKPDLVFIDDYAHHPEELRALINGAKSLFPDRRCSLIFQPHLFSRTRDFADEFAGVLSLVDNLILLPIYPARELPMEGVNSEMILKKTALESKAVLSKEALMGWMENQFAANRNMEFGELVITAGAGDIDKLVEPIKQILTR